MPTEVIILPTSDIPENNKKQGSMEVNISVGVGVTGMFLFFLLLGVAATVFLV